MPGGTLFHITVTFALVTGTAAGLLSLLTWEVFRRSVYGRVIFVFTVVMSLFIIYHALLLVMGNTGGFLDVIDSLLYTGLVAFVLLVLHVERKFSDDTSPGVTRPWQ